MYFLKKHIIGKVSDSRPWLQFVIKVLCHSKLFLLGRLVLETSSYLCSLMACNFKHLFCVFDFSYVWMLSRLVSEALLLMIPIIYNGCNYSFVDMSVSVTKRWACILLPTKLGTVFFRDLEIFCNAVSDTKIRKERRASKMKRKLFWLIQSDIYFLTVWSFPWNVFLAQMGQCAVLLIQSFSNKN